ncbi:MAG: V-type ATP synthase subunit D, partial [Candidatus Gracilibacteria bacterium]|nr:V-type ATP synthase subunit D [Candidatus Gracilibacteria bacterium]
ETTRRRVNALEYKMIPDIKETLKFISMKLAEQERSTIVGVMAIKAMIEAQEEA